MSANTQKRIISAFVMLGLLAFFLTAGKMAFLAFILLLAMIIVDEVFCNFLNKKRFSLSYFFSQALLVFPFVYFNFFSPRYQVDIVVYLAVLVNLWMIMYLFYQRDSSRFVDCTQRYSSFTGAYVLFPFVALGSIIHYESWHKFLILLIIVNYGMDTGAWFFREDVWQTQTLAKGKPQ